MREGVKQGAGLILVMLGAAGLCACGARSLLGYDADAAAGAPADAGTRGDSGQGGAASDAAANPAGVPDAPAPDAPLVADGGGQVDAGGADALATDAGPADAGAPGPSCEGLANSCGPSGTTSCCAAAEVPGGTFYRGYDEASDTLYVDQTKPATVSTFRLDLYEVTVGRFRKFVEAGMGTQAHPPAAGSGKNPNNAADPGWDGAWSSTELVSTSEDLSGALDCNDHPLAPWTPTAGANENRPIWCVTWYEAFAFCIWDGGRLPTEAEWHYAASGGREQRAYPWSDPAGSTTLDSSHASYDCLGDGVAGCTIADWNNVGTKPAGNGRWGHADLGGNVEEWVLDWWGDYPDPCVDCANLTVNSTRVVRNGCGGCPASYLRSAHRTSFFYPDFRGRLGFRCARTP